MPSLVPGRMAARRAAGRGVAGMPSQSLTVIWPWDLAPAAELAWHLPVPSLPYPAGGR
jgi:hypothetical protein